MGEVIDIKDIWTNVMIENAIDDIKTTGNEMLAAVLQDSMDLVQTREEIKICATRFYGEWNRQRTRD